MTQVAILVDDMIDTGKTLALATRALEEAGAKAIFCLVSHGLLSEANFSLLESLPIEQLIVSFSLLSLHSIVSEIYDRSPTLYLKISTVMG